MDCDDFDDQVEQLEFRLFELELRKFASACPEGIERTLIKIVADSAERSVDFAGLTQRLKADAERQDGLIAYYVLDGIAYYAKNSDSLGDFGNKLEKCVNFLDSEGDPKGDYTPIMRRIWKGVAKIGTRAAYDAVMRQNLFTSLSSFSP